MKRLAILFVVVLVLASGTVMARDADREKAAISAAEKWLSMIDSGNYAKSWGNASEFFRNAVKEEQWEQAMTAMRKPLGKMRSRHLQSKHYAEELPGAPDGDYVVIQYSTSFENKKTAVETITPMLEKDGTWRVSGYFLR